MLRANGIISCFPQNVEELDEMPRKADNDIEISYEDSLMGITECGESDKSFEIVSI